MQVLVFFPCFRQNGHIRANVFPELIPAAALAPHQAPPSASITSASATHMRICLSSFP